MGVAKARAVDGEEESFMAARMTIVVGFHPKTPSDRLDLANMKDGAHGALTGSARGCDISSFPTKRRAVEL